MRQYGYILYFFVLLCFSCDLKTSDQSLPESVGKYGHVLIVIDTALENAPVGVYLDSILSQSVYGLPQAEPFFTTNTVPHIGFKDILRRASNIIRINISGKLSPAVVVKNDVWAQDQLVIDITAGNASELRNYLEAKDESIVDLLNKQEITRWNRQLSAFRNEALIKQIADSHQISLKIPDGYFLVDSKADGFWIKKEKTIGEHQIIQALMVYYYPYVSDKTFGTEEMLMKRNKYTNGYIKGMTDSSYMKIYEEYPISIDTASLNRMYAVEFRGLWNMENDFMGGPFVHYTILDEKNNRIINLDAFVYAPKFNKREYVRELDAIMHSIEIPS